MEIGWESPPKVSSTTGGLLIKKTLLPLLFCISPLSVLLKYVLGRYLGDRRPFEVLFIGTCLLFICRFVKVLITNDFPKLRRSSQVYKKKNGKKVEKKKSSYWLLTLGEPLYKLPKYKYLRCPSHQMVEFNCGKLIQTRSHISLINSKVRKTS